MTRVVTLLALAVAVSSCAALKQGLQEASEGIKPDPAAIPEGTGWYCYTANQRTWSGCWRTEAECNSEREKNKVSYSIDTLTFQKWGACNPVAQAYCVTSQAMTIKSDGTGGSEANYDCMPDDLSCGELAESRRHDSGRTRASDCGAFK